jgi:hypothetical protein
MTALDQFEDLRRSATQVDVHQHSDLWPRLGFVGRGVVYLVVAALALQIAWSRATDTEASKEGAVRTVAEQPAGHALLVVLAVAFSAYALWRLGEAVRGHRDELRRRKRTAKRVHSALIGVVYAALAVTSVRFVLGDAGAEGRAGSGSAEESWTAEVLAVPGGQVLVGAAAVVLFGVALWMVHRALSRGYEKRLDTADMGRFTGRLVDVVGVAGLTARAAVVGVLGYLLLQASLEHDPSEAAGVDEALRSMVDEAYGRWIVTAVAAGLACYGLYSWIEARFRRL